VPDTREWLETNGLGGFASSTVAGLHTRRYHGLLVAALRSTGGRVVMLSKLEESVIVDGRRYELSANQYPGTIHPNGYEFLREFRHEPFPAFTFRVEEVEIEKRVFMIHGQNKTVVEYEVRAGAGCVLELRPLIAFRDYHSLTRRNPVLDPTVGIETGMAALKPYVDLPALYLAHNADELETGGSWYHNFQYDVERERGMEYEEDLFQPLTARFYLSPGRGATVIASTAKMDARLAPDLRRSEIERRIEVSRVPLCADPFVRALAKAADQFIVRRGELHSVIAGYHWFSDWGRDAMISLPGLTLVTGRYEMARRILRAFAAHADRGMLPNSFPAAGEKPSYNTVDASLWMFGAVHALLRHTADYDFVRAELYPTLQNIVEWYWRGTRFGIRVDGDGLVMAGEKGVQLTWMDAKVGEWVVTPRQGKAVEIQALWYHALRVMELLAARFEGEAGRKRYEEMASRARAGFLRVFWNEEAGCLYDVVDGERRDGSIRPNQILAVSLEHSMLTPEQARSVVDVVRRELLTPFGLRTLSPTDPEYRPHFEGDMRSRDAAYHQGTVWPWLMGPFADAYLKVNGRTEESRGQVKKWLAPLRDYLGQTGLGQIPEIFDGGPPHHARGCMAQAWSVAELLRITVENTVY